MTFTHTEAYVDQKLLELTEKQREMPQRNDYHAVVREVTIARLRAAQTVLQQPFGLESTVAHVYSLVTGGSRNLVRRCVEEDIQELHVLNIEQHPLRRDYDARVRLGLRALEELQMNPQALAHLNQQYVNASPRPASEVVPVKQPLPIQ